MIAIGCYAIGILAYVFKAIAHCESGLDPAFLSGLEAPFVVMAAWLQLRRMHHGQSRSVE